MIISNKIYLKINPSNKTYFKQYFNDLIIGEIKEIDIKYLSKSSHLIVDVECDICNKIKEIEYRNYIKSISNYGYYSCSQRCSKEKCKKTSLKRYGVENPGLSLEIQEKNKQYFLQRYGVENPGLSLEIQEKNKQYFLQRYGVENPFQSEEIKDKIKQTNLQRYGVENPFQSEEIKDKIKKTNLERYCVENTSHSVEIKNKTKKTNLERYGVEYPFQSEVIKEKINNTIKLKYGVENPFQSEVIKEKIKKTNLERYGVENPSQSEYIYNKGIKSGYKYKKHNCGLRYQGTYEEDFINLCLEKNIKIKKAPPIKYILNNKNKKYFPDFYIEDLNLIIEIKSSYYYKLHEQKNIKKKEATIDNNYNYILIMDKNYDEFLNLLEKGK